MISVYLLLDFCDISGSAVASKLFRGSNPFQPMPEIEVTYSVFGFDEAGQTSFVMEISSNQYDRLYDADLDGESLDSYYICDELPDIHERILKAIRNNMYEESLEPDDGMVVKRGFLNKTYKKYSLEASHQLMSISDDDDIEYEVNLDIL